MKRFTLVLLLALASTVSFAETYSYFLFINSSENFTAMASEGLEMTVADGVLTATNGSETQTFALSDLTAMRFSTTSTTDVEMVVASSEGLRAEDYVQLTLGSSTQLWINKSTGKKVLIKKN